MHWCSSERTCKQSALHKCVSQFSVQRAYLFVVERYLPDVGVVREEKRRVALHGLAAAGVVRVSTVSGHTLALVGPGEVHASLGAHARLQALVDVCQDGYQMIRLDNVSSAAENVKLVHECCPLHS